ncbi:hypothetical protein [Pelobium manganitolerans]|uniref:hypothetical protein n=1 Tax=Pelobium manganitolerans TaxID=1842495 RepID=UPI003FA3DADC
MKKLFFILCLLCSQLSFSQELPHFFIVNKQLAWAKVYDTNLQKEEIAQLLRLNGLFKEVEINGNIITARLQFVSADYEGAGYNILSRGWYVANSTIGGKLALQFKDGKYRAVISGIVLTRSNLRDTLGISVQPLADFALKKNAFKTSFVNSDSKIYDYTFSNLFDFNAYVVFVNDNW